MQTGFIIEAIKMANAKLQNRTDYHRITESWREAYKQVGKFTFPVDKESSTQCRD